jgi:hypothetical protein
MRFKPTGFGDDDPGAIGSSESEDETQSVTPAPASPVKRKRDVGSTEKAVKKARKEEKRAKDEKEIKKQKKKADKKKLK